MSPQRFYSFYKLDKKRRDNWMCPECVSKVPKSGNLNTPIRPISLPISEPDHDQVANVTLRVKSAERKLSDSSINYEDYQSAVSPQGCSIDFREFFEEMRAMRTEMSKFSLVVSDLAGAIKAQNARIDMLESRIIALEGSAVPPQYCDISGIEETVAQLKMELEERNQDLLANDLEIAGFPESNNENTTHIVLTIAKKLGVLLDERDVVSAWRVGAMRARDEGGAPARIRPVALRLARRVTRDALLQAARVRRRLSLSDMDLPNTATSEPSRPFYINERLTRHNRHMFQITRVAAKRVGWRYVWTRDGNVFARQESGKPRKRLGSVADLIKVFGPNAVSGD